MDANWRTGSKTMVIKSVANSTFKAIVFAIRGTASFMDWVVNLDMAPVSPVGFLVCMSHPPSLESQDQSADKN